MFATVDFGVGGIETSLINLLNQFDYNKYNVKNRSKYNASVLFFA